MAQDLHRTPPSKRHGLRAGLEVKAALSACFFLLPPPSCAIGAHHAGGINKNPRQDRRRPSNDKGAGASAPRPGRYLLTG